MACCRWPLPSIVPRPPTGSSIRQYPKPACRLRIVSNRVSCRRPLLRLDGLRLLSRKASTPCRPYPTLFRPYMSDPGRFREYPETCKIYVLQRRTIKTEQTFRLLSKKYRNREMFFDHNRAGKWRSRHDSAIILHENSVRIFLVKSDTPFCSVAGWCSQETSVKYIRNRRNVMNMSSTKIENGGFGLKLCGNECRSNHTSFRTGLDPKYSYKNI